MFSWNIVGDHIKGRILESTYYAVIADQVTVRFSKVFSVTDVLKIFEIY